ncbi:hypothetical protein [Flavobacterium sp. LC2016-12]|uniref:hypothetical protein n=1 Tax=Flavobacterium sp. LC2016-12 TaxID=2783794 RepID=UPI00188B2EF5|nr:hypothetical protein [Flavobacterium sp. LC2016-12]MBF4464500.1 hypothetical protein [Flavobacterium sp. LC2016-12]
MKKALKIFLLLISTLSFAQNKSENEIFKKIIDHEIEKNKSIIYIQCKKPNTSFNIKEFKEENEGFVISESTLQEFEKNNINTNEVWNSELIKQLDYIKNTNCLTKEEIELIFKNTNKRQNIILISKPIFDNGFENCIISIVYSKSLHSSYGQSYFLKKVNGIWTIITGFGHWMS